jgi:hypothetical protein
MMVAFLAFRHGVQMKINSNVKKFIESNGWMAAKDYFEKGKFNLSKAEFADQASEVVKTLLTSASTRARIDKDADEEVETFREDLNAINAWKRQQHSLKAVARRLGL